METKGTARPASSSLLTVSFILSALWLAACKDEITNITYERGSLTDPAIMPQVIFTFPAPNAVGPFEDIFNSGDGYYYPHFIIQFNKLINDGVFVVQFPGGTGENPSASGSIGGAITIEGFDEPTVVRLFDFYGPEYSDIFAFRVYPETGYYPPIPFEVDHTYTVTVDTSLEDINGNHLMTPYRFSFSPEPFFRVVGVFPTDGVTDLPTTQSYIDISFNSTITPPLLSLIQVQPQIQGTWQIDMDSSRAFLYPYSFFDFNTTYSITLSQDAEDRFGNSLTGGFQSTFSTSPFEVKSSSPQDGDMDVSPGAFISAQFTGYVDTATIRSSFAITPNNAGEFTIYSDGSGFAFYPLNGLLVSTTHSITLSPSLTAWNGTTLSPPTSWSFTTEQFRVTSSYPSEGEKNVFRWHWINVNCNSPLDSSTVSTAFSVSPPIAGSISYYQNSTSFVFIPSTLLDRYQLYTVTISKALRTAHSEVLLEPYTFSFMTGP